MRKGKKIFGSWILLLGRKTSVFVFLVFSFLMVYFVSGCKKAEVAHVPVISFVDISPSRLVQYKEPVYIRFSYKDLHGDVGQDDPDTYSLEIRDSRLSAADSYHIPPLSPPSSTLNISGELKIKINKVFLIGNARQETTSFRIRIKDKAGNWSNEITTTSLVIDSI
jgi:hypothetical protein